MRTYGLKKSLFYAAIVTAVLLLLLESVARAVEFLHPPPEMELRSKVASKLHEPRGEDDRLRIFVYGGSTVAGQPLKNFGFVAQLEFWLGESQPERPADVFNFGKGSRPSSYVRTMVEQTATLDPDLLIVLTGHNEFLSERIEGLPDKIVASFALTRVLFRLSETVKLAFSGQDANPSIPIPQAYDRDSEPFKDKIREYLRNLSRIAEVARENNIPLLLMTAPANLSDWPPAYRNLTGNGERVEYESRVETVHDLLAAGMVDDALDAISELVNVYGEQPIFTYLLARAHAAAGDFERARALFMLAKDSDPVPWRVLSDFNQAIRELAERDGVYMVDVEQIFQQYADNGLVGFSLVADNCHPTPLGNALIAREILALMRREKLLGKADSGDMNVEEALGYFLSKTTTPDARRALEVQYLIKNGKYSMKTPFFNFRASRWYFEKALLMDPANWELKANLATLALFENRIDAGRELLEEAVRLRGSPIDESDRRSTPYLKEALEQSGVFAEKR